MTKMVWKKGLKLINLDLAKTSREIDAAIKFFTEEGARVWLTEVLLIVPTWSRASRATFEALAQSVGFTVTYGPRTAYFDGFQDGIASGFGGVDRLASGHYEFYYKTNLQYLIFNEENRAFKGVGGVFFRLITPTPYNFLEAGEKAFLNYAKTVSLPEPVISSRKI